MCCNCLLWLLERLSNFLSSFLLAFSLPRFIMEGGGNDVIPQEKKNGREYYCLKFGKERLREFGSLQNQCSR